MLIQPFPALTALALAEASDIWDRHVHLFRAQGWDVVDRPTNDSDEVSNTAFQVTIQAQLDRLCDMTRPASRDALVRLCAPLYGVTAPDLSRLIELRDFSVASQALTPIVPALLNAESPAHAMVLLAQHTWPTNGAR